MAKEKQSPEEDLAAEMLLKEADEALQQEKLEVLWKEWGGTIIGVALMLVFGTMLGVGWKNWRHSVNAEQTQIVLNGIGKGTFGLGVAESEGVSGSHKGLINLITAGDLAVDADTDTQKIIYNMMNDAEDAGMPDQYEAIATWAKLRAKADIETDTETHLQIAHDMVKAANDDDNPYAPAILAEAATLYGENGNPQRALDILKTAKDHKATTNNAALSDLIQKLTHLYTIDAAQATGE